MPLSTTPSLSLASLLDAAPPAASPCCEDQDQSNFNALLDPQMSADRLLSEHREPHELPPGATDFSQAEQIPPPAPAAAPCDTAAEDGHADNKSKPPSFEKSPSPGEHHV